MEKIHTYDEDKVDFHNYDAYVRQIQLCHMRSITSLIDYFKKPIIEDENCELFLARAFFIWMAMMYAREGLRNCLPEELQVLFRIYPELSFSWLCKSANIQQQVVEGIIKDFKYELGDKDNDEGIKRARWNVFRANGRWHIVNIVSGIACTGEYSREGEILLESDGKTVFEDQEGSAPSYYFIEDDFWFCINPSIFIYHSFPDCNKWQLLPPRKRISKEEFFRLPHLKSLFFISKLQLLSEHSGILFSKNGKCTVSFRTSKHDSRYISMNYRLSLRKGTADLKKINAQDLPLLVVYSTVFDTFSFNIRFPVAGEYIFETFGSTDRAGNEDQLVGHYWYRPRITKITRSCAIFKIVCLEPDPFCKKLPLDVGTTGYGFGYMAADFGLKNPSTYLPNVPIECTQKGGDVSVLTFQIDSDKIEEVEFYSEIVGENAKINTVTHTRVDEVHGKLHVTAGVKKEGEYALSIKARNKQTDKDFSGIANYQLSTNLTEEEKNMESQINKRKKELTYNSKMQERHERKSVITAKIKKIELEIENFENLRADQINTKGGEQRSTACVLL